MFSRREIAPESKSSDATTSFRFASFLFVCLLACLLICRVSRHTGGKASHGKATRAGAHLWAPSDWFQLRRRGMIHVIQHASLSNLGCTTRGSSSSISSILPPSLPLSLLFISGISPAPIHAALFHFFRFLSVHRLVGRSVYVFAAPRTRTRRKRVRKRRNEEGKTERKTREQKNETKRKT